ncbi:TonB-dependent receptor domain-containing protein [Sphingomonas immobilis]|uniref:TonB-dependent receptor n=1 Tax=Sphingomonas immobilis TaxID=3063997 RepID=A0ABT8ZZR5_9SPHN|nr:TonB-dependent receptor [Sphingomonas sp. CA1-15]MDO7842778.1 TonB-dependent receptor [Sphingomonas sp. CA1-15]
MKNQHRLLPTAFAFSTSASAIALAMMPVAAHAQTASLPSSAPADAGDEEVVVTGSRIRTPSNFETSSPVTVITKADTALAGNRTVAEILQDSNVTSGTAQINNNFLGYVSEGGPGANTVGLRGLGSQRTLVLLNGRRLPPAGVGPQLISADLNVLPNAVLSRVEILKEGASSVYGSDAVGGVINLITDTKLNGVTLDGYSSVPFNSGGAGTQYRLSVTAGKTFERGHILASFEYRDVGAVKVGDREDFSCPTDLLTSPTTGLPIGQTVPGGTTLRCFPFANGGVGTAQNYVLGISALTTGQVNRYTYANGNINTPINVNNTNIRPLANQRQLQEDVYSPVRTYTGYLNGSYELGILGDAEIYAEGLFTHRESQQEFMGQISFDPTQIGFEVASPALSAAYPGYYPVSSPFFPTSLASAAGGSNDILRVFIVPPILKSKQKVDFYRVNGGLRGSTGIGDIRYDANFQYSRSQATYSLQNIDTRRLRASLQPVLAPAGTPAGVVTTALAGELGAGNAYTCASNVTAGAYNGGTCIAGDFFNPQSLQGNLDPRLFNYIYGDNVGTTMYEQKIAQLVIDGTLFRLPAGPVGFALGGEYRSDSIDDNPSEASQTRNLYNYSSSGRTRGTSDLWEVFGEVKVPLIKDKPFAYALDFNGSVRYTNNNSYGSSTTYHVGGNYAPTNFLRFRGTYGTSFRAPNLYEQFVADQSGFSTTPDPCREYGSRLAPTSNVYKNCASEGLPLNFISTGSPEIFTSGGGKALRAETSTSWGGGFVVEPKFAKVQLAVDYFNTTVNGEVSQLGAQTILQRCYESSDFRAGNVYCSFIGARESVQNTLTTVQNAYLNIASQQVSGIDFDFRYQFELGELNNILSVKATRIIHQNYQPFAELPTDDYNGTLGNQGTAGGPKWVGTANLIVSTGPVTFRYAANYVGPMTNQVNTADFVGGVQAVSDLHTAPYVKQDLSVQLRIKDLGEFTLGMNNVFDRKPEMISSTDGLPRIGNYFNYSGYDFLGRSVFVEIVRKF